MAKERLDLVVVEKGLFPSREKARSAIMAGLVFVNNQKIDKPGTQVALDALVEVRGNTLPYVSRGGLKLEKALKVFDFSVQDCIVLDIGASTGGFTDCALQNGARKVYAVDVGYGQLDWSLRQNPQVVNKERTNIRYVTPADLDELAERVVIDASFISLRLVLPKAVELSTAEAEIVALIKPQFEAGREKVGKKGVVKDPAVHKEVINQVIEFATALGLTVQGLDFSPIKGPEGNIEYLLWLAKSGYGLTELPALINQLVIDASQQAGKTTNLE